MEAVKYHFAFPDGRRENINLTFSPDMIVAERQEAPWTTLSFHRCDHCPLPQSGVCPFAAALAPFLSRFDSYYSYEPVSVLVVTDRRTITADLALQHGLASLIGLVGATSGCPHLAFFRPMARSHLPFATEHETLMRAFSIHMLRRYFAGGRNAMVDVALPDLQACYQDAMIVNRGMADRLRAAFKRDAAVNAIVTLDTFAQAVPFLVEEKLDELVDEFR